MQTCDLLIKDGSLLIKYDQLEEHVDMAVSGGRILETGKELWKKYQAVETINGKGKLFMPGLIDSHMHTGQQLLKGLVLDAKPIIWTRIMLPFESTRTSDKMRLCAQAAALEMIKCGTAGFIDAEEALKRTDSLYDRFHGKGNLKVYYSLRALNSCSSRLVELEAMRARERGTMLQAHMNEYMGEINGIVDREGMRPYEYLEKMHVLGSNFLGAHSLILSEQEKSLVMERGVKTCHCPFSNCGKAVPDTPQLLEMGIPVGLGSDGAAHGGLSLWNEMKIFRSVMNIYHGVPNGNPKVMPAETILKIVLEGGAAALNEEGSLGRLEAGYKADIISINMDQPHLCPTGNKIHTLFECVNAGDVEDMIVGGRILMKNREVLSLDEERIMYESRKYMEENADTF